MADVLQREPSPLCARLGYARRIRPSLLASTSNDDVNGAGNLYFRAVLNRVQGQTSESSLGKEASLFHEQFTVCIVLEPKFYPCRQ